jgi:hypothetical protein
MRARTLLICVLLALLPLRGWATVVMPSMQQASDDAVLAVSTAPCHEPSTSATSSDAAVPAAHAHCASCDLCHAAFAFSGDVAATAGRQRADSPCSRVEADTGRALPGGLERPPRIRLA